MLLAGLMLPAPLLGQVRLGVTLGSHAFAGATAALTPGDSGTIRPHGAYAWGVAASWQHGPWIVRIGVGKADPGIAIGTGSLEVVDRTVLGLLLIEPALARRLLSSRDGGSLWIEGGPSLHRWSPFSEDARAKLGGSAALVWRQRAAGRLDLAVRAFASASASPFEPSDLPPDLEPATLWRTGVTLELGWRL